jgi:hypothetical protein
MNPAQALRDENVHRLNLVQEMRDENVHRLKPVQEMRDENVHRLNPVQEMRNAQLRCQRLHQAAEQMSTKLHTWKWHSASKSSERVA